MTEVLPTYATGASKPSACLHSRDAIMAKPSSAAAPSTRAGPGAVRGARRLLVALVAALRPTLSVEQAALEVVVLVAHAVPDDGVQSDREAAREELAGVGRLPLVAGGHVARGAVGHPHRDPRLGLSVAP